jgi:hypothetical protein
MWFRNELSSLAEVSLYRENGDFSVNLFIVFRTRNKCDSRWNSYLHCGPRGSCEDTISPCTWTRRQRRCSQSNSGADLWWPSSPHKAATLKHNVLTLKLRTSRSYWIPPPVAQKPLVGQGLFIIEASRSHSVGLLWTADRPDAETSTWQHTTLTTDIHTTGGIRTHYPGKRVTSRPRLRPRWHWYRHCTNKLAIQYAISLNNC